MTEEENKAKQAQYDALWHPRTHKFAAQKYDHAIHYLHVAEEAISEAAGKLASLNHAAEEYRAVSRAYDQIKQLRRTVAYSHSRDLVYIDDYGLERAKEQFPELDRLSKDWPK